MKKWKNKYLAGFGLAAVAAGLAGGITISYLSDEETKINTISFSELEISLKEPDWDALPDGDGDGIPDSGVGILPGSAVLKNPIVAHEKGADAYVYLQVNVPRRKVRLVSADGKTFTGPEDTDLFGYQTEDGWELIREKTGPETHSCLYAYTAAVLKEGEFSSPLFKNIYYADVLEGELPGKEIQEIRVQAFAIQSEYLNGPEGTVKEQMETAYQEFLNQSGFDEESG